MRQNGLNNLKTTEKKILSSIPQLQIKSNSKIAYY